MKEWNRLKYFNKTENWGNPDLMNHHLLMIKLNSKKGKSLAGKWVAVANRKIINGTSSAEVLKAAKKIEPERKKILLNEINDKEKRKVVI